MNKKGFTLVELLATIIIMASVLLIVYPSVTKLIKNNDDSKYSNYEKMMVEYASINPDKTSNILNLNDLDELADIKRECIGYVVRTPKLKAYIKCGSKYQTNGFNNSNIN